MSYDTIIRLTVLMSRVRELIKHQRLKKRHFGIIPKNTKKVM